MIHDKPRAAAVLSASLSRPAFACAGTFGQNASDARVSADDAAEDAFRGRYRDADYYSTGRDWNDYAPAYRYGHRAHAEHPGCRFEDVEAALADGWNAVKDASRLVWAEARGAVLDAWRSADAAVAPMRTDRATD